jgi:hypothetical protein
MGPRDKGDSQRCGGETVGKVAPGQALGRRRKVCFY